MTILFDGVTKSFGQHLVLDSVTDEVPDGSLTALLGPSGSGKSTLLKIIAGLETLDEGRVSLNGKDVTTLPARFRNIGFCFQDYAPFNQLSVFENVAYGLRARKQPKAVIKKKVTELLELVRLGEFSTRYPRQLSGGQRQRMALARALAIEPEVLLLDEPFAALDAQVGGELRLWVRSLQRELGMTTILVTHNQSEAMEVADRLVIFNGGRIEQVGTPSDVYDKPANDFVHGFLGPTTLHNGAVLRPHNLTLKESGPSKVRDIARLGFEVRVHVTNSDGTETWVQLTHDEDVQSNLSIGDEVTVVQRPS
jgi:sulfate/thiosulfate transport system ATP-binding protein